MRHFLSLADLSIEEIQHLLDQATRLKAAHQRGKDPQVLRGRVLGLVFEKPSLRTRLTFEIGVVTLGGTVSFVLPFIFAPVELLSTLADGFFAFAIVYNPS